MTARSTTHRSAPARMRRNAAIGIALLLLPTCACTSSTTHAGAPVASTARPCVVGTTGCGPLPTVPTHSTPDPLAGGERGAPHPGLLRAGSYTEAQWHRGFPAPNATNRTGIHLGFSVPAGWSWNGRTLSKGNAAISSYASPVRVYADPCHWDRPQHRFVRPAAGDYAILSELATQPMRYATHPTIVSASSRAIRLTVPSNLDFSKCDHGQYRTWGTGANTLLAQGPGQRDLIWISTLPWTTKKILVDAATFPSTPARLVSQVDAILASVGACVACG
jgi:hypothetical protein